MCNSDCNCIDLLTFAILESMTMQIYQERTKRLSQKSMSITNDACEQSKFVIIAREPVKSLNVNIHLGEMSSCLNVQ